MFGSTHGTAPVKGGMSSSDAAVNEVVNAQLGAVKELDEDVFAYILGIVMDVDAHGCDPETLGETVSTRHRERDLIVASERERWGLQCVLVLHRVHCCTLLSYCLGVDWC